MFKKSKITKYLSIVAIIMLLASVFVLPEETHAASKIHLQKTSVNVTYGTTYQQKLINKSGKVIKATSITWKSNNTKIAKINKNGKVTAIKVGTAKMTAKYKGKTYKFTVYVKNPTLRAKTKTMKCGATYTQKLLNANGKAISTANIKFTSSNTGVATVSKKGIIKAKTAGKVTITAKYKGKTFKSTITIKHDGVIDAGIEATCTETGLTEGKHCSVCNKTIVKQQTIPATGHIEVVDAGIEATYTETGLTEGKHCSVCGMVLVAQEIIPVIRFEQFYTNNINVDFMPIKSSYSNSDYMFCNYKIISYNCNANSEYVYIDHELESAEDKNVGFKLKVKINCISSGRYVEVGYVVKDSSGDTIDSGSITKSFGTSDGKGSTLWLTDTIYFPAVKETYTISFN